LLELLQSGVVSVRRNAAAALGQIGPAIGAKAADALITAMQDDPMVPVQQNAAVALGRLKPFADQIAPALEGRLADESFFPRTHAACSLWQLTDDADAVLPTLISAMDDLTHFQDAMEVLAKMGPAAAPAVDRLIDALDERDPDDRVAAAWALSQIGPPAKKAIEPMKALLDDDDPRRVAAAAEAIAALSDE